MCIAVCIRDELRYKHFKGDPSTKSFMFVAVCNSDVICSKHFKCGLSTKSLLQLEFQNLLRWIPKLTVLLTVKEINHKSYSQPNDQSQPGISR